MTPPPPIVDPAGLQQIAPSVWIIPDRRVPLVPNVGFVAGDRALLVIDCGMGPANGAAVLAVAERLAQGRRLILTTTHFHPEHAFGAQAFRGRAEIVTNAAQDAELAAKGAGYLALFRGMSPDVAAALDGTEIVAADRTWQGDETEIDLGGRSAVLKTWGPAHTRGDQVVWLPDARILFTGDLAEERIFPIFPWFPPDDTDIDATGWLTALDTMVAMAPSLVVPGHGAPGDAAILRGVAAYLREVAARVRAGQAAGEPVEALAEAVTAAMRAAHPDWDAPEWIGFAVRYFADRPL
jgi:glyoxylase-like metal-dependent hydrolase (beta-lactamase superfamily II)